MHVYEVLLESDKPNLSRMPDGRWQITYPDGRAPEVGTKDEVIRLAQEFEDRLARTRGDGRVEPRVSSDDPLQRRPSGNAGSDIRATRDVDHDAVRQAAGEIDPTGDDRRSMRPDVSDVDAPETKRGILSRLLRRLFSTGAGVVAGKLGAVGAMFSTVLTAAEVEEELDRMVRTFLNDVERQRSEGVEDEDIVWSQTMEDVRLETVDKIADLAINGIVTLVVGATSGAAIWGTLGLIIGSGPVGWIAAIVGGGILGFYGAAGVIKILEWTGVKDDFVEYLNTIFTAEFIMGDTENLGLARRVDQAQGIIPGVTTDDPIGSGIGARGNESIQESSAPNEAQIMAKFKKAMETNPKLRQAFNNGKDFGREVKQNLK